MFFRKETYMQRLFNVALFLLFLCTSGYSTNSISSLGKRLKIRYDTLNNLSIHEAIKSSFDQNQSTVVNFGLEKGSHWVRLSGQSIPKHHDLLEITNFPTQKIEFYSIKLEDGVIDKAELDIFAQKSTNQYFFTGNAYLKLPKNHQSFDYFLHFPPGKLLNFTELNSGTYQLFSTNNTVPNIYLGLYAGFIIFTSLASVLMSFLFKRKSYSIYALYTASMGVLMLIYEGYAPYILGEFSYRLLNSNPFFLTSIIGSSLILFVLDFFKLKEFSKKLYYIGITFSVSLIPFIFLHSSINKEIDTFYQLILLCAALYSSGIVLYASIKGNQAAFLFLIGYLGLISGVSILILRNLELEIGINIGNPVIVGHVLETFFFSFGIVLSIVQLKRENEESHQNIIEIQRKANSELEQKVNERTDALLHTNNDLSESLRLLNKQNKELADRNKQIKSSIAYASQIQFSLFPHPSQLKSFFSDSFVLNKPRDKVSGDFYYFEELNVGDEIFKIVIVGDCTGHGVPGAFMTLLGYNLLKNIVSIGKEVSAKNILTLLNAEFDGYTHNNIYIDLKDGMDMSVISYNSSKNILDYAGAKLSLLHITPQDCIEIKGTRKRIGGFGKKEKEFESHQITPKPGDCFYMYSDGYADQLGGPNHKKLMFRNFVSILKLNRSNPMHDQKERLEKELFDWQGQNHQTDDILVLGIKI